MYQSRSEHVKGAGEPPAPEWLLCLRVLGCFVVRTRTMVAW
jgi:hypothetical protein